jgi:hypothetical protein
MAGTWLFGRFGTSRHGNSHGIVVVNGPWVIPPSYMIVFLDTSGGSINEGIPSILDGLHWKIRK